MRRLLRTALFSSLLLLVAGARPAEQKPNFSGTWKADLTRSDFRSLTKPRRFVRTITQNPGYLIIAAEIYGAEQGDRKGELRFTLDGESSENQIGDATAVGFARRIGQHILLRVERPWDDSQMVRDELWSLSADGRTLRVDAIVDTPMGEEEILVIFDKQ